MQEIARRLTTLVVEASLTANSAAADGNRQGIADAQRLVDSRVDCATQAAVTYTNLGGDWESRPVANLQALDTYHSLFSGAW